MNVFYWPLLNNWFRLLILPVNILWNCSLSIFEPFNFLRVFILLLVFGCAVWDYICVSAIWRGNIGLDFRLPGLNYHGFIRLKHLLVLLSSILNLRSLEYILTLFHHRIVQFLLERHLSSLRVRSIDVLDAG